MTECWNCSTVLGVDELVCPNCKKPVNDDVQNNGPDRGNLLGFLIFLVGFRSAIALAIGTFNLFRYWSTSPAAAAVSLALSVLFAGVQLYALWAMWRWKKSGVFTFFGVGVVSVGLNYLATGDLIYLLPPAVVGALMIYGVRRVWAHFQ